MNTPNNLEWLDNELDALVGVGFLMAELGKPLDSDIQKKAVEVIKQTIATKLSEARTDGKADIVRIGKIRASKDPEYTLDAFVKDMEHYIATLTNDKELEQ